MIHPDWRPASALVRLAVALDLEHAGSWARCLGALSHELPETPPPLDAAAVSLRPDDCTPERFTNALVRWLETRANWEIAERSRRNAAIEAGCAIGRSDIERWNDVPPALGALVDLAKRGEAWPEAVRAVLVPQGVEVSDDPAVFLAELREAVSRGINAGTQANLARVHGALCRFPVTDPKRAEAAKLIAEVMHLPQVTGSAPASVSTWELLGAQRAGAGSAADLCRMLGVSEEAIGDAVTSGGGERTATLERLSHALACHLDDQRAADQDEERSATIAAWLGDQARRLMTLSDFGGDRGTLEVLDRAFKEMGSRMAGEWIDTADLRVVVELALRAPDARLDAERILRAESREAITRHRLERAEAALAAALAPQLHRRPWAEAQRSTAEVTARIERAVSLVHSCLSLATGIRDEADGDGDLPEIEASASMTVDGLLRLGGELAEAARELSQIIADATHERDNAPILVAE